MTRINIVYHRDSHSPRVLYLAERVGPARRQRRRRTNTNWLSYYRHAIYMLIFVAALVAAIFVFGGSLELP